MEGGVWIRVDSFWGGSVFVTLVLHIAVESLILIFGWLVVHTTATLGVCSHSDETNKILHGKKHALFFACFGMCFTTERLHPSSSAPWRKPNQSINQS